MARTKDEFSQRPSTTDQRYVIDSIPFPGANRYSGDARREFYTRRFSGEQRLYLYNINTQEETNLRLIPDSVSESYSPKVVSVTPFGVVTPVNYYVGGGAKTVSFSFKMHEDLQNKGGSIYNVIQTLENMVKPVFKNGQMYDPIVYFQLGEQFVGRGHISTSFSYNKPFRNGRYSLIEVSMTFTFHEEFEEDPIELNDGYVADLQPNSIDSELVNNYDFVDDFIKFQTDPDYFISQVFGSQKFRTYFNAVFTTVQEYKETASRYNQFDGPQEAEQFFEDLQSATINELVQGNQIERNAYFDNPYMLELIDLIFTLREVMFNARDTSIDEFILYFENIKKSFRALRDRYKTSTFGFDDYGWYPSSGNMGTGGLVQMSDKEKQAFEELLELFEKIVDDQVSLYSNLRGAGN